MMPSRLPSGAYVLLATALLLLVGAALRETAMLQAAMR